MQRPQRVHSAEWRLVNSCSRNPVSGPERCPSFPLLVLVLRDTCNATLSVVDSFAASRCRTCLHPGDRLPRALQFRFDRFLGPSSPLWSRTSTHHYWAEDDTGSADETLSAGGAVFVVPIPLGGAGLLFSPRVHFHMGTPAFRNHAGVAAEFGSHASAPIATHSQRMLRYSFRSLCAGQQKRSGYSPPRYR